MLDDARELSNSESGQTKSWHPVFWMSQFHSYKTSLCRRYDVNNFLYMHEYRKYNFEQPLWRCHRCQRATPLNDWSNLPYPTHRIFASTIMNNHSWNQWRQHSMGVSLVMSVCCIPSHLWGSSTAPKVSKERPSMVSCRPILRPGTQPDVSSEV